MRMFRLPGKDQPVDGLTQFQIGDQIYPAGWLHTASPEMLEAIGVTAEDIPDNPTPSEEPSTKVDGLTFLKRLSPEEYATIITASDHALAAGSPQLALWLDMVRVNSGVDVAGPDATMAKQFLVQSGLLTEARAERIFALPGTVFPPDPLPPEPEPEPEPQPDPQPAPEPQPDPVNPPTE